MHFTYKDIDRVKEKGWEKDIIQTNQKKARVSG